MQGEVVSPADRRAMQPLVLRGIREVTGLDHPGQAAELRFEIGYPDPKRRR